MEPQRDSGVQSSEQTIEELQERYKNLHTRKTQAETNLENAKKQLESLKKKAREEFGTDDVAQLQEKLDSMKRENEAKRRNYQQELDRIEADLSAVEQDFAPHEGAPDANG